MTSRLHRIREIYEAVAELPADEREQRVRQLCAGDPGMRAEIEELLELEPKTVLEQLDALGASPTSRSHPERIGPYEILGLLGRGGMGVVYRARQSEPIARDVALKLLHLRASEELIKRFHAERQTLALMDHVHIAKVFDAGSTDRGEPYFVMELIEGAEIDVFCEKHRLGTRERVRLVIDACHGVQHAHQRGIIHRDLKPSNLLVKHTKKGPLLRIIDFGVARIQSELEEARTLLTQQGQILGTPEYMSPEQAEGNMRGLDARSDVYSLGVVLYRLLSGRLPYDLSDKSVVERARIIASAPPAPLTQRQSGAPLDSDLETIVRKAMEKEPDLRFASVGEMGADLERFLEGLPINARPPSTMYQMKKLVRRHRLATTLVGLLLLLLIGFGVGMTVLAESQRRALALAELERNRSNRVRDFLEEMLSSADPSKQGKDVRVLEVLEAADQRAERELADEPAILSEVYRTLGTTYRGLGSLDASREHLELALQKLDALPDESAAERFEVHFELAATLMQLAQRERAQEQMSNAEALVPHLGSSDELLGRILGQRAMIDANAGRYASAESLAVLSLERYAAADREPGVTVLHAHAWSLWGQARIPDARRGYEELFERHKREFGLVHPQTLATALDLSGVLAGIGMWSEAHELNRQVRDASLELYGADHVEYANSCNNLAVKQMESGMDLEEAAKNMAIAISVWEKALASDHPNLVSGRNNLGFIRSQQLRLKDAEAEFRAAREINPEGPEMPFWNLGWNLVQQRRADEARALVEPRLRGRSDLPAYRILLGWALQDLGRGEEARNYLMDGLEPFLRGQRPRGLQASLARNALARLPSTSAATRDSLLELSDDFLMNGADGNDGSWLAWRICGLDRTADYFSAAGDLERASSYAAAAAELRRRATSAAEG